MAINNIDLSDAIRYLLSGLIFILFVVALPLFYLTPEETFNHIVRIPNVALILIGIIVGYFIDMLKLYQFTPMFYQKRDDFNQIIRDILELNDEPTNVIQSYYSLTTALIKKNGYDHLKRQHSEWLLMLNSNVALLFSLFSWIFVSILKILSSGMQWSLLIPAFAFLFSMLVYFRIANKAARERAKMNTSFCIFLENNKESILNSWKFEH